MRLKLAACLVTWLAMTGALVASEVRIVRFQTVADFNPPPCVPFVEWSSQSLFHNTTDVALTVQFLGVSNGDSRPSPKPLLLPPHQTVTVEGRSLLDWEPVQPTVLWVNRLDVPTGVIVANRVESGVFQPEGPETPCRGRSRTYAGLPLPVFSTLIPAGTPQYFLGTDVGQEANVQVTDARLNIGVFNGGSVSGNAVVRIYCGEPGQQVVANSLLLTDQLQILPNNLVQKTVLASTQAAKCPTPGLSFWYAVVTVDQPSFAYAIGMANGALPTFPGVVALSYTGN